MSRIYRMLQEVERPLFLYVNIRWNRSTLNWLFHTLSLLAGATFSLSLSLLAALFAPEPWNEAGRLALASVVLSHIPVAIAKRSAPRLRPYQVFPQANTNRRPLKDPSFPSGHTTAAFAMLTPWMMAQPLLIPMLLPIGIGVALSRVYFGLHFPSDTAVGALLGASTAFLLSIWI
ncbi:phosphatase PAP2 family protein [Cohnella sp. CIP 111063]|uniref:phosphatase PAP2 family protein n=1 Tax=unclassified Cohnella TaxID=2636738 RepID=UPI000B8C25C1|nr:MULTISPECIES: phosphatase PAP2 family protein [unclassified Cohnella]OXS58401.1 phosphatase PAP2 family protein [Cohnella sp. CIP 111063]PRX71688.1 undecaprenyl-diphosphatase [Cohnella sp. SGD-V74]